MDIKEMLAMRSGMYSAKVDGKDAVIMRDVGHGFSITVPTHHDWYETNSYDENGEHEGVTYDK